ncbi:MAG: cytochrome c3 family protein [Steroidobacteraceae bacterium]
MTRGTARRIAIASLLSGVLLISPPAVSGGLLWDLGIACGYLCVVLCVCLYIFPVRGDGLPHARLLGLSQHRLIGWCLLAGAVIHTVVLIAVQPLVGRYLLPSTPLYIWCGIAALVLGGVLVQTGLSARSALRRSGSRSQATVHIIVAALMILTLCAHVVGSAQLTSGKVKTVSVLLLLALPLGWFAMRARSFRQPHGEPRRVTHLLTMAAVLFVPSPLVRHYLLEPPSRPAAIPVNFPHESHTQVTCVECHHNFVDRTGMTACIECHRSGRHDLGRSSESTFHTFCRACHARRAVEGASHGPTRSCSDCHRAIR